MRPALPPRTTSDPRQRSGRGARRVLPFLLIAAVLLAIAAQEIPAVGALFQRWFQPDVWQATQTCRSAALALATRPDFARVVDAGRVHATQGGFYVEAMVIGEMAETGGEQRLTVACYTDTAGRLVRADRVTDATRENTP